MRIPAIAVMIAVLALPAASAEKKQKVSENRYYIDVEHQGNEITILINKVLYIVDGEKSAFHYSQITQFLKRGRNNVSLIWENMSPFDTPVTLTIREVPKGVSVENGKMVVVYKPDKGLFRGESARRTFGFVAKFPDEWSWTRARRVRRISEEDKTEMIGLLTQLHDRFAAKDAGGAVRLLETMFLDMDFNRGRVIEKARRHYAACMKDPDWAMYSFPSQEVEFKAYGRLVRAWAPGSLIAARELKKCGRIEFHAVYFAKLEDGWTIVRAN